MAGRPSINESGKTPRVVVPMSDDMRGEIAAVAEARAVSNNQVIRDAVAEFIERHRIEEGGLLAS